MISWRERRRIERRRRTITELVEAVMVGLIAFLFFVAITAR